MKALILAGGSGIRLWPVSRIETPKQFLKIGSNRSLLQITTMRMLTYFEREDLFFLTNQRYTHLIRDHLRDIHPDLEKNILLEPCQRNTAPAIAFALKSMLEKGDASKEEIVFVTPSDQSIEPQDQFYRFVDGAFQIAKEGRIATFGILPTHPETGYGYIRAGASFHEEARVVESFVEKPDFETAKKYIETGHFYWNSGMFAFQIETMFHEFETFCKEISQYLGEAGADFEKLPNISIDCAVMEKSKKTVVLPMNLAWSDVGSWDSVFALLPKDQNGNATIGETIEINTKNSLVYGSKKLIATIGLEEVLIVDTPDVTLIAKKQEGEKVKEIVSRLKTQGRKEVQEHLTMSRPWGSFTVLDSGERYKIKKIFVNPGEMLSLQMHYHRSEHWVVVKGVAKVTIQNQESFVHENESIYVPKGSLHRVSNPGKISLEIIETQVGEYLGEDDIVRFQDVYGRNTDKN